MFMRAVACVDDRDGSHFAGILCGALDEMPHRNHVGIIRNHEDGVFECLSLAYA